MDCAKRQQELRDYAAGELSGARLVELEAHLAACPDCRREVAAYQRLYAALGDLPDGPAPPVDLHSQVMSATSLYRAQWRADREARAWTFLRRVVGTALGGAFVVALVAALAESVGRVIAFSGRSFSQDLAALWEVVRDFWYLCRLVADLLRILEPSTTDLGGIMRGTQGSMLQLAPLVFVAYGALLFLGGWLCWRALRAPEARRLSHAS